MGLSGNIVVSVLLFQLGVGGSIVRMLLVAHSNLVTGTKAPSELPVLLLRLILA